MIVTDRPAFFIHPSSFVFPMWRSRTFWRLFGWQALLVLAVVGLLGLVIYQRAESFYLQHLQDDLPALRRLIRSAAGLTALGAMALAFWLARRITRPLQELTAGAERIAAGG